MIQHDVKQHEVNNPDDHFLST